MQIRIQATLGGETLFESKQKSTKWHEVIQCHHLTFFLKDDFQCSYCPMLSLVCPVFRKVLKYSKCKKFKGWII